MDTLNHELRELIPEVGEFIVQQGISFLKREIVTPIPWFINFTPDEKNYRMQVILRRDKEDAGEWYFLLFHDGEYLCILVFTGKKGEKLERWQLEKLHTDNCHVARELATSLSDRFDIEIDVASPPPLPSNLSWQ
jgi:hypothetical protein